MMEHLAVIQVLLPLLAAPLCLILGRSFGCWLLATLVSWLSFIVSLFLLAQVNETGLISYAVGGWEPPWGIEIRVDKVSAFVLLIVTGISSVVLPYAKQSVTYEIETSLQPLFYTAHLLCLTGLIGIVITGDAFNLFVFLEISSLSTYTLVSLSSDRRSLTAAYRYLVMGTIGATFILIGVGMLYMKTGTLNMLDLSERIPGLGDSRTIKTALAFIIVGVSLKLALFPLHLWMPNAYAYAPSAVSAFLAATATKVAVYVLLRFIFSVFGSAFVFEHMGMGFILLILAVIAVFAGSISAAFQKNIKKLLAYSSVAQIGYIMIGISFATTLGLSASIMHLFNHALMKGALFMALGAVFLRMGSVHIDAFRGLGRQMPFTMAAFTIGGLSLIGVPLTVGFISKWYLVSAALNNDNWLVAGLILVGSLLAVIYIWRVVEVAYFQKAVGDRQVKEAPMSLLVPMWVLVIANVYFGIDTTFTVGNATEAAQWLMQQNHKLPATEVVGVRP